MTKLLGANWKTTLHGIIAAAFLWVANDPALFSGIPGIGHFLVSFAKFGAAYGVLGMGLFAKDHDITGGTKPNNK